LAVKQLGTQLAKTKKELVEARVKISELEERVTSLTSAVEKLKKDLSEKENEIIELKEAAEQYVAQVQEMQGTKKCPDMCIYVYMCVCIYIYIYIYIYICIYMYIYIYVYVYIYLCINTNTYIHLCIYTYVCIFTYVHMHMDLCLASQEESKKEIDGLMKQILDLKTIHTVLEEKVTGTHPRNSARYQMHYTNSL